MLIQLSRITPRSILYGRLLGLGILVVLCALTLAGSLMIGARDITASQLWEFLLEPDPEDALSQVVWQSRVPRTVLIAVAGAAFGVAGALIQAVTRNPLTDPGILGVNAGAALAVVVALAFFNVSTMTSYMWWALAGALISSITVFIVGNTSAVRGKPITLTLVGVAFAAVLGGFTSATLLTDSELLQRMRGWSAGTTASQSLENTLAVVPLILVGLCLAFLLYRSLDVLALGDASAIAMGARPGRIRLVALIAIALLAGAATAAMGPVGFIGLVAPHVCKLLIGPHQGWIMAYCVFVAPIILGCADVLGRVMIQGEIPVGVVTPFIGGPVLIYLVHRLKVSAS